MRKTWPHLFSYSYGSVVEQTGFIILGKLISPKKNEISAFQAVLHR